MNEAVADGGEHRVVVTGDDHGGARIGGRRSPRAGRVEGEVFATIIPAQTGLGDALTALAAVVAIRARLTPRVPAWTLIGQLTYGRLVSARAG